MWTLDSNPGLPQFSCLVRLVSTPPILKKCCAGCDPPAHIEGRCPSTTRHSVHFSPPHVRQSKTTGLHSVALSRLPSPLWAVDQVHAKCNPLSAWWRNLWPSATFQLAGHLRWWTTVLDICDICQLQSAVQTGALNLLGCAELEDNLWTAKRSRIQLLLQLWLQQGSHLCGQKAWKAWEQQIKRNQSEMIQSNSTPNSANSTDCYEIQCEVLQCLSSNPVWVFKVCSMQWPLVLLSSQLQQCDLSWSF